MPMQAMDGTAAMPQRQNYQDTAEMVGQEPATPPEGMEGQQNPLMPAMETIAKFIQIQEQRGNPAAEEMKQHIAAFLQAAMKGGEQPVEPEVKVEVPEEMPEGLKGQEVGTRNVQPLV